MNPVAMTAGAIALLLALYAAGKSLARASRQIHHILHAAETRKEKPKP